MFCEKCGTENENGAKFCKKCGADMRKAVETPGLSENLSQPETAKKKALPVKWLIALLAAAAAAVVIVVVAVYSGSVIDLNRYLIIETTGYEGYGTATATIDWDAIEKKYGKKLSVESKAQDDYGWLANEMTPTEIIEDNVSVYLDHTDKLSNGDSVAYSWDVDGALSSYVNCKIKYKDGTYKVSGLEQVGTIDAFADLKVEFSGISPYGSAELTCSGSDLSEDMFTCDKSDGLSNGETIRVTIDESCIEDFVADYGKVPETLEKEYTVEGLGSYVSAAGEIPEDILASMQQQASDVYQAYIASEWGEGETLDSLSYLGNYLLTKKGSDSYGSDNILYLVYKAQVKNYYSNGEQKYDQLNNIYWYISFSELIRNADGTVSVDLMSYDTPSNTFTVDSGVSSGWFSTESWYYHGYPSLDELYQAVVTSHIDLYNHEENVTDGSPAAAAAGNSPVNASGYILPTSDTVRLTRSDLEGLTAEELKKARNEIYARHGRMFQDEELQAYFNSCEWYHGTIAADDFQESDLTDIEKANRDLIVAYEKEKGYQ